MERDLIEHYNWQFLRLNEEYRTAYDKYKKALEEDDENTRLSVIFEVHRKWGLSQFLDYKQELLCSDTTFFYQPITTLGPMTYDELTNRESPIKDIKHFEPNKDTKGKRYFLIAVDLEKYQSRKGTIDKEIKNLQENYFKENDDKKPQIVRSDKNVLDRIIRAYNLSKEKPDWNNHQIAKELLKLYETPENKGASKNSSKVSGDLRAAKKYIDLAPNIHFSFK